MSPPFSFTWIDEDRVGACSAPSARADLDTLRGHGITLIVNLLERPYPDGVLDVYGMKAVHLAVRDFKAPTSEQIDTALGAIDDAVEGGGRAVVHCAAGLGRTGTIVACYLARRGMTAADAIARVKALRPGSLETPEQEGAVGLYVRSLRP